MAAASLAITAWGTYKAALVADDQLTQSKEASIKETRAAASLVNWWRDGDDNATIANRWLDPIWVSMYFHQGKQPTTKRGPDTYVFIGVLPPCTAVQVPYDRLVAEASRRTSGTARGAWHPEGIQYFLSDGTWWVRNGNSLLLEPAQAVPTGLANPRQRGGLITGPRASSTALQECTS
ncbi:hypothetical protein K377_06155 [Streptomyces sp. PsTaAH-137]|nr:hypothetical protein K377_06155 [Streptomyces sp. PsTaAH-137]